MKAFLSLTKSGIVWFVLLSAAAGYAMSFQMGQEWDWSAFLLMLVGLYFVSSGSFAINQAQEWSRDAQMARTQNRPIPAGRVYPWQGYALGLTFILWGLGVLYIVNPTTSGAALFTVALYNGLYTLYWKRHWSFGAVPGAIPGAMPIVIGYSANTNLLLSPVNVYLFLLMFLWQMPHFWCLAIRYKEDYARAGFPVLPLQLGVERTLYHIGLYVIAYVGMALAAPLFLHAHVIYLLLVVPMALKVAYEFYLYQKSREQSRWLPFFMWVNFSLLVFVFAPVADKWLYNYIVV